MNYSAFFHRYILFVALLALPVAGNSIFLYRAGEFMSVEDIVNTQQESPGSPSLCIYGTALHSDTFYYKLAGYEKVKPHIAAVGSSRSMQLRSAFFSDSFYNLGGTVRSAEDLHNIISGMLRTHTPDTILLNLDFWWFSESYNNDYTAAPPLPVSRVTIRSLFLPFLWLYQGKISASDYWEIIAHGASSEYCSIGLSAIERRDGSGPDGSNYYISRVTGHNPDNQNVQFKKGLEDIQNSAGFYKKNQTLNARSVDALQKTLDELKEKNINVIVYFPPVAPTIYNEQSANDYAYIAELKKLLTQKNIPFFDFHNPSSLHTSDCEFIDDHHGGDIVYARLLQTIAASTNALAINENYLNNAIQTGSGFAMIKDPRVTKEQEIDFLRLGCGK